MFVQFFSSHYILCDYRTKIIYNTLSYKQKLIALYSIVGYPKSTLFTIYSDSGDDQLALSVGRDVGLFYSTNPDDTDKSIFFGVNVSDGKWHRLGVSVKGDAVTIVVDCDRQVTKELRRSTRETISTAGIVIIGQQLVDGNLYLVSKGLAHPRSHSR